MNSCNPFFIYLGQLLGTETFLIILRLLVLQKTGIDLPGEASTKGLYHDRDMSLMDLAVESFGQNFSITPIQMITACAAIANGGYLVQPHVVSQIVDNDGNIIKTADTTVKRQVISEETSKRVSKILQENATSGTAKNGYVAGYRIAGKTGTSEKLVPMVKLVVIINTLHLTAVLLLPMTRNMRYWYSLMNQRETVTTAALLQALCLLKLWRKFFHT